MKHLDLSREMTILVTDCNSYFMTETEEIKCSKCLINLCGEVKEKVSKRQADHLIKTGRHMSREKAIYSLILGR